MTTNLEVLASEREIEIVPLFTYGLMKFVGPEGISGISEMEKTT